MPSTSSPAPDPVSPIRWKLIAASAACAALSACGGGGGSVQTVSSLPLTPPPPPPPPPPPINYDTAEFRRSDGPAFHGADAAWGEGATGDGEIIAVIDTGIDSDSPEFADRLHPMSRDLAGNRGLDPDDDHGSNVALVAAGARDGSGALGVAFDAELLALRADLPGSCGGASSQNADSGCVLMDTTIANGVDLAIEAGATVINLSIGGGEASAQLRSAIARAADAGIVVVVSAGNGGGGSQSDIDPNQPNPFASSLLQAGNGNVIIAGSVNENGDFSDFSNRAGSDASSFLSARGERICCVYEDGELFVETVDGQEFVRLFSGTSFAAPQVAGAVALLAQAFPNLTAQEITEILLDSARDAGESGVDSVFGTGILDIAAAFEPRGTTKLAGTQNAMALTDEFALASSAMGDALSSASLSAIITDRYGRAYTLDLGPRTRSAAFVPRLSTAALRRGISQGGVDDGLSLAVTIGEGPRAAGLEWSRALQLSSEDALGARVLAARIAAQIAPEMQIGFALSHSAHGLTAQLQGSRRAAFMIAPEAGGDTGFASVSEVAVAARREWGRWGLTVSAEQGRVFLGDVHSEERGRFSAQEQRQTNTLSLSADRKWRGFDTDFSVSWLSEESTVLGAQFNPAFGLDGAQSVFLDGRFSRQFGSTWRLGGSIRAGFTLPRGGPLLGEGASIRTQGWSFDISRRGTFLAGDSVGFRVSQPLRVTGGGLNFDLPVAYDYASESAVVGRQTLSLAPNGSEILSEFNWSAPTAIGTISASVFHRKEPGHVQNAPSDVGALITLYSRF